MNFNNSLQSSNNLKSLLSLHRRFLNLTRFSYVFLFLILVLFSTKGISSIKNENQIFNSIAPKAIYGDDNRLEAYESNPIEFSKTSSIAGMIEEVNLLKTANGYQVKGTTLNKRYCENSKYSQQILGPHCTGFLVAPQIIATAGHCILDKTDCENNYWIFDYRLKDASDKNYTHINDSQVYKCQKVLVQNYKNFGAVDYSLIQLDRPVNDRPVLPINFNHKIQLGDLIFAIGFPKGLPLKVVNSAVVIEDHDLFFRSNLDVFQGNSGSPVFDAATGTVIGIISNGHADYVRDGDNMSCKKPKVCNEGDKCHLSASSKIQNLESDLEKFK